MPATEAACIKMQVPDEWFFKNLKDLLVHLTIFHRSLTKEKQKELTVTTKVYWTMSTLLCKAANNIWNGLKSISKHRESNLPYFRNNTELWIVNLVVTSEEVRRKLKIGILN